MAGMAPNLISGRVLDAEGNPIAAARVYIVAGPGSFPDVAALTDDGGSFILSAPTPGSYEIQSAADGFVPQTVAVTVGEKQGASPELVLERA